MDTRRAADSAWRLTEKHEPFRRLAIQRGDHTGRAMHSLLSWVPIERARPGVGWYLACFNKHRDAIEHVANVKHQRGQRKDGGAVIVQGGDLKSSGS